MESSDFSIFDAAGADTGAGVGVLVSSLDLDLTKHICNRVIENQLIFIFEFFTFMNFLPSSELKYASMGARHFIYVFITTNHLTNKFNTWQKSSNKSYSCRWLTNWYIVRVSRDNLTVLIITVMSWAFQHVFWVASNHQSIFNYFRRTGENSFQKL